MQSQTEEEGVFSRTHRQLGYGVIGNTTDSGPVILGSSPDIPTSENVNSSVDVFYFVPPVREIIFSGQKSKTLSLLSLISSYARHLELEIDEGLNIAGLNLYDDVDNYYNQQCLQDERHACNKTLGPL